jgi:hypothetical protein
MSKEMVDRVAAKFEAGCEKLPEGPMRENCEKKKKDKGDKKEAAKGEVPEAFKKEWKNKDKDNDGKENEPKPDFLKDKKSSVPKGVVAAMTQEGKVEIFDAPTPKAASAMKEALKNKGGYQRIASGPNAEERSVEELYDYFEERWASDDEE